ncbi:MULTISPECIES: esterase-like activity of phytase family protein [unclassified Corynebacterium]|uniref:esterase-like activity of phytase family protein n=1 Tax=unclassified Corynebacterium TaxID=2624378 RepID=UPI001EF32F55|nr:esterase-like activity of phytase family protein [Corynebacterium sp. ACRPH]MCG7457458.1 esterase-like activity of phytase family protein [Corynebacterium sp. ACRPH]
MQLNNFKNSVSQRAQRARRSQRKVTGISLALAVIPFAAVPAAHATVGSETVVESTLGSSSFGSSAGSSAGSTAGSSLPGSSAPGSSGLAGSLQPGNPGNPSTPDAQSTFERTATYPVYENRPEGEDKSAETVAEISTVSKDGKTLIHTDALAQRIGFIDISDPSSPKGLGTLDLKAQGHAKDEPTSVAVYGDYLLVVIDETAGDFANPKGRVDIVRISDRTRVSSIDLQGQPDSIAISPAGAPGSPKAAIAMENQRDEELNDGNLPQLPTGFVQTIDLSGDAKDWKATPIRFEDDNGKLLNVVKKAGLDTPEDLEPEYVSINGKNQLAVTLQENNGVAIIDLQSNRITNVFSAGSAEVKGVDTQSDKIINPTDTLPASPREPDAIAWIDDNHVATANEGDWKGGTRGWTVFDTAGKIVWDAGNSVENLAIRHGLHNNKRAKKKGVEIEGIATAKMNGTNYAFVGSERSNFVAVYNVNDPANPQFVQMLFTTNGPEGILPIPERNMLAVSSEVDEPDNAVRSAVTLYRLGGQESQPSIVSADQGDAPIGWGALGALTADPKDANRLYAASDSAYANGWVYTIDASKQPAVITERRAVKRDGAPAEDLDIEGISVAADGGFWIASEGKKGKDNRLFHTDKDLNITSAVELPADVAEHIGKWGLEGVSSTKDENGVEQLFVAVQRPLWKDPEAKDREALEGDNTTRIGKYDTKTKQWQWFGYELEKSAGKGDWMGLSEITALDDKHLLVIERDKLNGPDAKVKRVMKVTLPEGRAEGAAASANGLALPMVNKELAVDVLPKLRATNGWTQEKLEGFTIAADGQMYAVTDNDALEDATGETVFLRLGKVK